METPNLKCFQNIQNILLLSYGHFFNQKRTISFESFQNVQNIPSLIYGHFIIKISPLNKTFYKLKISLTYTHRETVNAHPVFDKFLEYLHSLLLSYGHFSVKW